ncbi:MAG TPA: putative zinc-binding metallopeptidase [Gemmatimonadaceae bacterium]|nr:putative zinc-binding metallopeptidase [Gemmatimonadaceae bacterium]
MRSRRDARPRTPGKRFLWSSWPTERLMQLRLRELGVAIEGTWVARCVAELYRELERKHIRLRPHVWLSDEWFSPANVPGFAVPFYLTHPRLLRLERTELLEAEGGSYAECMQIMRHESGHAVQHAYQLHRRREWRRLFGKSSTRYPESYRPNPASKRFVQHLRRWYAQSHPDEDFAETFAVWLRPRSDWRRRYAGWPALRKLQYVDRLMKELAGVSPIVRNRRRVDPLRTIGRTLFEHYTYRRALYSVEYPATYDEDLQRLFSSAPRHRTHETAASFLRRHRSDIRRVVAKWTGEYQFTLDAVLGDMIGRCRMLKLRVVGRERQLLTDFMVLLTARTMEFIAKHGRRDWIAV